MGDGKFKKGDGRSRKPKGAKNKATQEIKEMIRGALDEAGGQEYLVRQAIENPTPFMGLIGKIIPADVNAKLTGDIKIQIVKYGEQE